MVKNLSTKILFSVSLLLLGAGCNANNASYTSSTITSLSTPTTSQESTSTSSTTYAVLSLEDVLNASDFKNGVRFSPDGTNSSSTETINTSSIIFGDLDGDGKNEAVGSALWCDASCGTEIFVAQKTPEETRMYMLTENNKLSSPKDTVKSLSIANNMLTVVRISRETKKETTKVYHLRFSEGVMAVFDGVTEQPLNTATYRNTNPKFSFIYPEYYNGIADCRLHESTSPETDWLGTIGDGIELSVQTIATTTSLSSYADKTMKDYTLRSKEKTTIAGVPGIIVEYNIGGMNRYGEIAFFKKGAQVFTLSVFSHDPHCASGMPEVLRTFDAIVKSFAF